MAWAVISIFCAYGLWLTVMIVSWYRITPVCKKVPAEPDFAVVVPFRNERDHLPALIDSLKKMDFDTSRLVIYLVDDHSDDQYVLPDLPSHFKLVKLPDHLQSKKSAISLGVSMAQADIIVTTDADCTVPPGWLQIVASHFSDDKVQLVFGGVKLQPAHHLPGALQCIEFASLIGVGAASWQIGQPIMCNGANMAFRKQAFAAVGGYHGNEHIPSGDDEFLLSKINRHYPKAIRYMKSEEAVVATLPQASLKAFYHQRIRWSGKWSANVSTYKLLVMLLLLLSSIATVIAMVSSFYEPSMMVSWGGKVLLDFLFLFLVFKGLGQRMNIWYFLLVQIVYPWYTLFFAVATHTKTYRWKGRKVG